MGRLIEVSIIIPFVNELSTIQKFLSHWHGLLERHQNIELVFIDGGSTDAGSSELNDYFNGHSRVSLLSSPKGRSRQMLAGERSASGRYLLFLHADTRLPDDFMSEIKQASLQKRYWGRFDVRLDAPQLAFQVISFFINNRSRLTGIATGDQAIFVNRFAYERVGGLPDQKLMEDVELSKRLKRFSLPYCSRSRVRTSARKWQTNGLVKTVCLMWSIRWAYYRGVDASLLHDRYYGS